MNTKRYTDEVNFYGNSTPAGLVEKFGSPLYVYNENILRERCKELASLISWPDFKVSFSAKANSNPELLKIIRDEGLHVDAMSPGEIYMQLAAGFQPEEIFFVCNNVSREEMQFAVDSGVLVSVDSLSQLDLLGQVTPGGRVAIRFNPGVGAGHHQKVVTAGKDTKFGVSPEDIDEVRAILKKHDLTLFGINQHIGSLFMQPEAYLESMHALLEIAENFLDTLGYIDFGGGFGIPYKKSLDEQRLDLAKLGKGMDKIINAWAKANKYKGRFAVEPGRYLSAECGVLLGTAHATKVLSRKKYVGTDLGFNVLARPVMYDSHHDIEVYTKEPATMCETVTVVGNICESGDIIAKDRLLPAVREGDLIGILDAGAYGFAMASNYNLRLRPAEVLVTASGEAKLIRRRDTLEDLLAPYKDLTAA